MVNVMCMNVAVFVGATCLPLENGRKSPSPSCELHMAHAIAVAVVVEILPEPLSVFFQANIERLKESTIIDASEGLLAPSANATAHFVPLEIMAPGVATKVGNAVPQTSPRDRVAAAERYQARGWTKGGWLPWVLIEHHEAMVRKFRSGEHDDIVREAGLLVHFAVDATWPFSTSREWLAIVDSDRNVDDNKDLSFASCRQRVEMWLLPAYADRLAFEVRVFAGRYHPAVDPHTAVFAELVAAHSVLADLRRMDREVVEGMADGNSPAKSSHPYIERMTTRTGPIIESRIEAGALLAANLIGSAWVEANRPPLAVPAVVDVTASPSAQKSTDAKLVGSVRSSVYHRSTCRHATRIKPVNLVDFVDVAAARVAKRRPCKTCQPEAQ